MNKRRIIIYIAGPITHGDVTDNVRRACEAGLKLFRAGLGVIVPHLTCYMGQHTDDAGMAGPQTLPEGTTYREWVELGCELVRRCDAVLRLPGFSRGADAETFAATTLSRPVFHSVEEVINWTKSL